MLVAEVVARTIVERLQEAGHPRAVWIKRTEVTHITGVLPSFLVEEIGKELAMASLIFAEVPGVGFLLIDPTKFTEMPTLCMASAEQQRRQPV
ncbi:hypothetical protein [Paraburkholderia sp. BCC1885]|uniref:hypothetical protein n=1 Tax=Paraburkholderia sp. BCC1885 TaxID=2562669 RepID=UPI001182008E|nr:hypothetical protein [Paraburkholderia sp. BCC1885]